MYTPIQQGDQYYLPFVISQGSTAITPDNCDDVKIQIGSTAYKYSTGELTYGLYDATHSGWLFPLTQEMTLGFSGSVPAQLQIKQGTNIFGSDTIDIPIDFSIIQEEW